MPIGSRGKRNARGLALLLAAIAGLAVLAVVVTSVRRSLAPGTSAGAGAAAPESGARLLLDEQLKLLAEQSEMVKEELRRLHDERIDLRRERIRLIADRYAADGARQYDRVLLRNRCNATVSVALYYRDLDDSWITRGWWNVEPGETVTTDAMTRNAFLYFFAENRALGRSWDGSDAENSKALAVVDARFDHLEGERFPYEGARTVSFYRRRSVDEWTDHVEEIRCYLEAPDPKATGDPSTQGNAPAAGGDPPVGG